MVDNGWIYDTPVHSDVEAKLRHFLLDLQNDILGIQVCAYKDGEVIIDTAAGVLGEYDPRPVQPDTLFPVFSATKGITSGMLHWLVDNGKLKLDENVANIWPEFGSNGKDLIKVHHVLNHTSGLHNATSDFLKENLLLLSDWDGCLNHVAMSAPETEPGKFQLYHSLSFGWLCGGIIECFCVVVTCKHQTTQSYSREAIRIIWGTIQLSRLLQVKGAMADDGWIYDTHIRSDVEAKLRHFLVGLQNNILGIQICAYKDGEVIIDTAAGLLGEYDPRPVQPDTLFPVFSATKGITSGMLHWLVDNGKMKLDENIANIWPEFGSNGKDLMKVYHVLNHTSGLHIAGADLLNENQQLLSQWDGCLNRIATSVPETEPGQL
ncbi:uncharacterized protein LOC107420713 [Ziziphus jujuba]|uniref:Uncharacterized protein LOC107420713 n=1 Tax=Ziziphus jujuba TaxID=326968 RepID=A0ABM4A9P3_ZIZJJ|nr:uncharacterized protein LOC107420713 [Ziziphus jujuba]XP_060673457.1 uncharacterized protein LOC107420713 [Ziziphus jujuba]XP_060673458.1 uncharacterized protein LOC107420713 [Ziziphus jujuba]